jgi:hypothetical protein
MKCRAIADYPIASPEISGPLHDGRCWASVMHIDSYLLLGLGSTLRMSLDCRVSDGVSRERTFTGLVRTTERDALWGVTF